MRAEGTVEKLAGAVEELAMLLDQLGDKARAGALRTDVEKLRERKMSSVDVARMQRILGGMASLADRAPIGRTERLRRRLCQALEQ